MESPSAALWRTLAGKALKPRASPPDTAPPTAPGPASRPTAQVLCLWDSLCALCMSFDFDLLVCGVFFTWCVLLRISGLSVECRYVSLEAERAVGVFETWC